MELAEILSPLGLIVIRKMFGGQGIYCGGRFFALIVDDDLYFRGMSTRARGFFEVERQLPPFAYEARGKVIRIRYFRIPLELLDEAATLRAWAALALEDDDAPPKRCRKNSG
jgi:DNA transformation protein and related proteins